MTGRIAEVPAPFGDELTRLDTIPGVGRHTAEILIAEIGVDMTQLPSDRHLASWAGFLPRLALAYLVVVFRLHRGEAVAGRDGEGY
jgi:Transposase IS116/IS110/IS902 family